MQKLSENIINERKITLPVYNYLKESKLIDLQSGVKIQILNPGYLNKYAGPDIKGICFLKDGNIILADAEIDMKSSYWLDHGHHRDSNFNNVKLHIVLEQNYQTGLDTIVFNYDSSQNRKKQSLPKVNSIEFQELASTRLKRKANLCSSMSLKESWKLSLEIFLKSYLKKRKRPSNKLSKIKDIIESPFNTDFYRFLEFMQNEKNHYENLDTLLASSSIKGEQWKNEIVINCVLPVALNHFKYCYQIWLWYWDAKSITKYAVLKNRFPEYSQNFIWQQQAMLEFITEEVNK